jgi:signal transduction histidine kinase/CheY-like chemotaxis protein
MPTTLPITLADLDLQFSTRRLVKQRLTSIACQADRLFAPLFVLQWVGAIIVAIWTTPLTWEGGQSSVHLHVWSAIILGGVLTCFPIYLAIRHPGTVLSRQVIAISQMLWSALLIDLTGGRIETHFHVFGSLAFLAWYRRPSVILTATLVVTIDHLLRGLLLPESVYGIATANVWRTLEHFSWVVFEVGFLLLSIRFSLSDMKILAVQQVKLEHSHFRVEEQVQLRTRQLQDEIFERKQIQAELAQRDEQLRQSHKLEAVGSLAGGIAHEFNNLLQAISGYTRYAMEDLPVKEQRYQDLEQVLKAADRAAALTRELLGFSRRQVLENVDVEPREIVNDLVLLLRPLIGAHIELRTAVSKENCRLHADRGLLQQMLINLCINARDAMPNGGELTIKTERVRFSEKYSELHPSIKAGNYVMFSVADTGSGMSAEVKERIFEPFYTTKGVGKGTGLGLSMVYGCVQQHEGLINVYSEIGHGTTFKIYLPLAVGDEALTIETTKGAVRGGIETILLAEDETMVRELAVRVLTTAGYHVIAASNGAEAVELFELHANEISILIFDAVMPKLTGHQAYEFIKQRNPDLPIVFCSGYDPETGQLTAFLHAGLPMIQKPFDPDQLLRTVREVLDRSQREEQALCLR